MQIHPASRSLLSLFVSVGLLLSLFLGLSPAQVRSNITSDGTAGTTVTQNGTVFDIDGGTIRGQNQFHSFDQFSVGTGDTASFNGPAGIENIISRVTGGSRSDIDGTVRSTIDGADVYLINPAGIMFGPNATLDVKGSFHASTADELRFADGTSFKVDLPGGSTFSVAAPVAFGFLAENPAGIVVNGSQLSVDTGETLSLIGGDLVIAGGRLQAESGQVNLVSVASSGEVGMDLDTGSFAGLGGITISDNAVVDVSGNASGSLVIRGGQLVVDNAVINAVTRDRDGAEVGIDIEVTGDTILRNGTGINVVTTGAGHAGDVIIEAGTLTLDRAYIDNSTLGSGDGGMVIVRAGEVTLQGTPSGDIFPTGIFASAVAAGDAGGILIEADRVNLFGEVQISSATFGSGHGGTVTIRATALTLEGTPENRFTTGIFANAEGIGEGAGDAGSIVIEADQVSLSGGAQISTTTFGSGRGGTITVTASEVTLEGEVLRVSSGEMFSSGIFAASRGSGDAGSIVIESDRLSLTGGAQISTTTFGSGQGGTITVTASDTITISGSGSGFTSRAASSGDGGEMVIEANMIQLRDGAAITAISEQSGNAGNITLIAQDSFLSDDSSVNASAINADGGIITLRAENIVRLNNSELAASVGGGAETTGGNLRVEAGFIIASDSRMVADAREGRGGNIELIGRKAVLLDPFTVVDASSELGIDGSVNIQAPVTNLAGVVTPLPVRFDPGAILLRDRCAERAQGKGVSRFVQGGRDQVPIEPDGVLPSPAYAVSSGWPRPESPAPSQRQAQIEGLPLASLVPLPSSFECERWYATPAQRRTSGR